MIRSLSGRMIGEVILCIAGDVGNSPGNLPRERYYFRVT